MRTLQITRVEPVMDNPNALPRAYKPLEEMEVTGTDRDTVRVLDGQGAEYVTARGEETVRFRIGGALGSHTVLLLDEFGAVKDTASFRVDTETELDDAGGEFADLLNVLKWSMVSAPAGLGSAARFHRWKKKIYRTLVGWFQDHVHTLKAMKYFDDDIQSGVDLFADGQREDGMIYDFYYHDRNEENWRDRFAYADFATPKDGPEESSSYFVRAPVENMSDFHFLEGLYYTWKANGDDAWMASRLDNALKAVQYVTTDPLRWSEKYQLLKRGYTIDIWDFQPNMDTEVWENDLMKISLDQTKFGILYADNIGLAVGCEYLAEMLNHVGRAEEAERMAALGQGIRERIDTLAWNGEFYTHRIEEDASVERDFGGTDTDAQVTLSNAYALNKRISHDKCVKIIRTYQRIRKEMPESSPGEWYLCYPPYEKGWHIPTWDYMNGGVSPITAGELAHGAFEHGYEDYAVDILRRLRALAAKTADHLSCIYKGKLPELPREEAYETISLKDAANASLGNDVPGDCPKWIGEKGNDFGEFPVGRNMFLDIPFHVQEPEDNDGRSCIVLSEAPGYIMEAEVAIGRKAQSVYLLQTGNSAPYYGDMVFRYADGSEAVKHITAKRNGGWWYPKGSDERKNRGEFAVAWEGKNKKTTHIGAYVFGANNPHPDKEIEKMVFRVGDEGAFWMVLGVTLSTEPACVDRSIVSFGAPDCWAAAAVIYAMIDGLIGIKDEGVAYNKLLLAPRWSYAGVNEAKATVKYEMSGGYGAYEYRRDGDTIELLFTGNAGQGIVKVPLAGDAEPKTVALNGEEIEFAVETVESSRYVVVAFEGVGVHHLVVDGEGKTNWTQSAAYQRDRKGERRLTVQETEGVLNDSRGRW